MVDRWFNLEKSKWSDLAVQAILVFFIVYKMSPLFFSFRNILSHPQSLFFFAGTLKGALIAGIVTIFYLWLWIKRNGVPLQPFLDAFALIALLVCAGYNLIFRDLGEATTMPWGLGIQGGRYVYHPLHYYRFLLLTALFLFWWVKRKKWKEGETFRFLFVAGGVGLLFISFLDYKPPYIDGLTFEQWVFTSFAIIGWVQGLTKNDSVKRKEK
ncbi:hypothetical protein CLV36_101140 [Laceyella sediminis]|jgi:hypothetical protein|uniref:Prolipoprotein diacylglyceryl transferase n=1 Tax=Laceyella sediminis TaxID=573074 RepID=A0ABX5ESV2_9BACL|nr:hypothetical protein CLV36_101140 [Laceyella sediminis]